MDARYTLKKNSDFRRLYSKGAKEVSPYMVVYCRRNRNGVNRLGYTVSSKLGHAVVRNRIRRRFREIYRLNAPALRQGYDIIIVARTRTVGAEYKKLESTFMSLCAKLNLLQEKA